MPLSDQDARTIINRLTEICDQLDGDVEEAISKAEGFIREWDAKTPRGLFGKKQDLEGVYLMKQKLEEYRGAAVGAAQLRAYCEVIEGAAWVAAGNIGRGSGAMKSGAERLRRQAGSQGEPYLDALVREVSKIARRERPIGISNSIESAVPFRFSSSGFYESVSNVYVSGRLREVKGLFERIRYDFDEALETLSTEWDRPTVSHSSALPKGEEEVDAVAVPASQNEAKVKCSNCGATNRMAKEAEEGSVMQCGKCGSRLPAR